MKDRKPIIIIVICLLIAGAVWFAMMNSGKDTKPPVATTQDEEKMAPAKQFIKTADNGIILFDASSSMERPFQNSDHTMYAVAVDELKKAAAQFPEIGHNIGLFLYNKWKAVYPVQRYNRQKFAEALNSLPSGPEGPTLFMEGLIKLESILKELSGKTVVFIYTDGQVTDAGGVKPPHVKLKELADQYKTCFYFISTAGSGEMMAMLKDAGQINTCSRVVPLETFIDRQDYNSGALYVVKNTP